MLHTYSLARVPRQSRTGVFALALLGCLPAASRGQDTTRLSLDSVTARLRQLEAAVEILQKQVADQSTSALQTHNHAHVELTGHVVMNTFFNDHGVNNVDDPQFVRRDSASLLPYGGLGMALRQTSLGMRMFVPEVAGGSFNGDVDVDFFGGQQPSSGGREFPLVRLRTARATLRWAHAQLMAGQEIPLFSPQNPVTPAALGTPEFAGAGNLWLWLPQLRGTVETGSSFRAALQAAVLAPTSGDPTGAFDTDFDAAERSHRPYVESRLRLRWGDPESTDDEWNELGCSGHYGWLAVPRAAGATVDSLVVSRAFGCDTRVNFTPWLDVRGEWFNGQGLKGLGGGGIAQELGVGNVPVRTIGGWAQLNVRPLYVWSLGFGCGRDDPNVADLAATARLRNHACAGYTEVRPMGPMVVGAEFRHITTTYSTGALANNHVNLAIGFEF